MNIKFDGSLKSMWYRSEKERDKRFDCIINRILKDGNRGTILDIGCGAGKLYDYLKKHNYLKTYSYAGIETYPQCILFAKKTYPEVEFSQKDILKDKVGKYDYVFCIDVMKNCFSKDILNEVIKKMFSISKKIVVFNVYNDMVDYKDKRNTYINIKKMLDFCLSLTPRVALKNDYRKYETAFYLYKDLRTSGFYYYKSNDRANL